MDKTLPAVILLLFLCFQIRGQSDFIGSGRALQFDAIDDYVDLGNIYDDIAFPLTISAWVYRAESDQYILPIFASQDNASIYNGFWFCLSATNLFFEYGDGRGDQQPAFRKGKSAPLPNMENRWIYVSAVISSAGNVTLFANGKNIGGAIGGSSDQPMASNFPGDVAKIGYLYTNDVTHRFEGQLDEVRIWNRALSENEIRQTMCTRLSGDEPNLIGYWNFDETSGSEVRDSSPNRFHGTLKGNPTRVFSGAPVGDESGYLYAGNWSGMSLSKDDVLVKNISGTPYGVHIYTVNSIPSQTGGLNVADVQLPYYGVFLADDGRLNTFDLTFTENNVCESFQRKDNSEAQWYSTNDFSAITSRIEIVPVFESSELDVDLGDDTFVCDETSHVIEATHDPSGKTFLWNDGQTGHSISVTASGQYSVEVTQGCLVDRDTIQLTFLSTPPAFSLGLDEVRCIMEPRTLNTGPGSPEYTFSWQDGSHEPSFVATDFGTYWVKIENACGSSADTVKFIEKNAPRVNVNLGEDVTFCQKLPFALVADPEPEGKTFQWNTGENTPSITVNSSGIYTVEVRSECETERDTIYISYLATPPAFFLGKDEIICPLEPRTLKPNIEASQFDLTWQDGSKGASFVALEFGTYWLRIENACGVSVDSITIDRKMYADAEQYNFISPDNSDDRNQFFAVDDKLRGSRLQVFNRWGKPVYQSPSYQNNWDGDGLPAGVYFYTVSGACMEPLKGSVTIMR